MRRDAAAAFTLLAVAGLARADRDADRDTASRRDGAAESQVLELAEGDDADAGAHLRQLAAARGLLDNPYGPEVLEHLHDIRAASDELEGAARETAATAFQISKERNQDYHEAVNELQRGLQRMQNNTDFTRAVREDAKTVYNNLSTDLEGLRGKIDRLLPQGAQPIDTWGPDQPMNLSMMSELDISQKLCVDNTRVHKAGGDHCALRIDYGCSQYSMWTFCHDGFPSTGCCCERDIIEANTESTGMFSKHKVARGCGASLGFGGNPTEQYAMRMQNYGARMQRYGMRMQMMNDEQMNPPQAMSMEGYRVYFCSDNSIVHKMPGPNCRGLEPFALPSCAAKFGGDIADFCQEGQKGENLPCCCSQDTIKRSTTTGLFGSKKKAMGCFPENGLVPPATEANYQMGPMQTAQGTYQMGPTQTYQMSPGQTVQGGYQMGPVQTAQGAYQMGPAQAAQPMGTIAPGPLRPVASETEVRQALNLCFDGKVADAEKPGSSCQLSEVEKHSCRPFNLHTYCGLDKPGYCCCDEANVHQSFTQMFTGGRSAKKCHEGQIALQAFQRLGGSVAPQVPQVPGGAPGPGGPDPLMVVPQTQMQAPQPPGQVVVVPGRQINYQFVPQGNGSLPQYGYTPGRYMPGRLPPQVIARTMPMRRPFQAGQRGLPRSVRGDEYDDRPRQGANRGRLQGDEYDDRPRQGANRGRPQDRRGQQRRGRGGHAHGGGHRHAHGDTGDDEVETLE